MANCYDKIELDNFLVKNKEMRIVPSNLEDMIIEGQYYIFHQAFNYPEIKDSYNLKICIPKDYPKNIPIIHEMDSKIPSNVKNEYHVNPDDKSLCLGSTIRLLKKINDQPSLVNFCKSFLDPYLYAVSHKLRYGGSFIFGELAHGPEGLILDYKRIFDLKNNKDVIQVLKLLSQRPRDANKKQCPCGCSNRLGRCKFRFILNKYRKIASRRWYQGHLKYVSSD